MNVEILEFFVQERDKHYLTGTMKVRLIDFDMLIMGIYVTKSKTSWWFEMPFKTTRDKETNAKITYPVVTFLDREKTYILKSAIREKGIEFIQKYLQDNPYVDLEQESKPKSENQAKLKVQERPEIKSDQKKSVEIQNEKKNINAAPIVKNSNIRIPAPSSSGWIEPPPLKIKQKKKY